MKAAILTQPLGHNYGGLLQAYALQQALARLGVDVVTIDRRWPDPDIKGVLRGYFINLTRFLLGYIENFPNAERNNYVQKELHRFRDQYICLSQPIKNTEQMRQFFERHTFDLIVVGSDQVWRPKYSPCIHEFYLSFLNGIQSRARRISYAASFGVDYWEYSAKEKKECAKLIQMFDDVSVREESAVSLCAKHFEVEANLVLDPTLLLDPEDYLGLTEGKIDSVRVKGGILCYILDPTSEKSSILSILSKRFASDLFFIKPQFEYFRQDIRQIEECVYPSVEDWISSFRNAEYVVTDSFHGAVFSILFNKPFWVILNKKRGASRFSSLLKLMGLEHRILYSADQLEKKFDFGEDQIDWNSVNNSVASFRNISEEYLKRNIEVCNNERS